MSGLTGLLRRFGGKAPIDYDAEKALAQSDDVKSRRRLASREDAHPEILYFLAADRDDDVRCRVAQNDTTPVQADLLLATDKVERVRCGLAEKIGRLAPHLDRAENQRLCDMVQEVMDILARDQLVEVRRVLAEALKDVPTVSPDVIRRLARDVEIVVAGPVLEHSPLLGDEDLEALIASGPIAGALERIACRRNVSSGLADAIVGSEDEAAIAALLGNESAQIREQTLDQIIDAAPAVEGWHGPLVRRPRLSASAVARIASFVADTLLEVLKKRRDLDPQALEEVTQAVHRRLGEKGKGAGQAAGPDKPKANTDDDSPEESRQTAYERALLRHQAGELNEEVVTNALLKGDAPFVAASIAILGALSEESVAKVIDSQSAKGMTALAWKAGLSMKFATHLQVRLARISPAQALKPKAGSAFPLSEEEMAWQIEFFGSLGS